MDLGEEIRLVMIRKFGLVIILLHEQLAYSYS
jgi:hypothetical protein